MFRDFIRRLGRIFFWVSKWVTRPPFSACSLLLVSSPTAPRHRLRHISELFRVGLTDFCRNHAVLRDHRHPRCAVRDRKGAQSSAPGCHSRGRLGELVHPPRALAIPLDMGDAVSPRSGLGHAAGRDGRHFRSARAGRQIWSFCVGSRRSRAALRAPSSASVSNLSRNA